MIKISWQERKKQQRMREKKVDRQYPNRTLLEASFTKRLEESEQEFRARIDKAWKLANQARLASDQ